MYLVSSGKEDQEFIALLSIEECSFLSEVVFSWLPCSEIISVQQPTL
jgi:hypothetical protein